MMQEFATQLQSATGRPYRWQERKIRYAFESDSSLRLTPLLSCLAHVINLATQLLISTYSKSPHFDPRKPEGHIPTSRDEVGLVRAIAVKVCTAYEFRVAALLIR